jgi:hypothetical protein
MVDPGDPYGEHPYDVPYWPVPEHPPPRRYPNHQPSDGLTGDDHV